jgi:hypothetical protein
MNEMTIKGHAVYMIKNYNLCVHVIKFREMTTNVSYNGYILITELISIHQKNTEQIKKRFSIITVKPFIKELTLIYSAKMINVLSI